MFPYQKLLPGVQRIEKLRLFLQVHEEFLCATGLFPSPNMNLPSEWQSPHRALKGKPSSACHDRE